MQAGTERVRCSLHWSENWINIEPGGYGLGSAVLLRSVAQKLHATVLAVFLRLSEVKFYCTGVPQ